MIGRILNCGKRCHLSLGYLMYNEAIKKVTALPGFSTNKNFNLELTSTYMGLKMPVKQFWMMGNLIITFKIFCRPRK